MKKIEINMEIIINNLPIKIKNVYNDKYYSVQEALYHCYIDFENMIKKDVKE